MFGLAAAGPMVVAAQTAPLAITLRLRDTAQVPPSVLTEAQEEVARIYRAAGVETQWPTEESLSAESDSARQAALTVAIVSDAQVERLKRAGLDEAEGFSTLGVGFAAMDASAGGRLAYVFYDRVQMVTGANGLRRAQVLAIAIAHEIGHLLLPPNAHSETGLMRADWTETDLAENRLLFFSAEQRELLRSRILASRMQ
jgi:hypothetical protein